MTKYLITGGMGFVGTNLIPLLKKNSQCEISILDNLSNPSGDLEITDDIELVEGDIRDAGAVNKVVQGKDVVIHLAAHTRVIDSIEDPEINFEINTRGTFNVLEAMRRHGVGSIVNASTGGAILGEVEPPVNEDIPPQPAAPYGASKLAAEGYCSAYSQSYGIKAVSLRFSNLYGPYSRNKGSVVAAFVRDIQRDGKVTVFGDGSQTRDYLYVDDLAQGMLQAIESKVSGVFQMGSGKPTTINQLLDIFRSVVDRDFDVDYRDFRAGELRHTYCDITKAKKAFNFAPSTELATGVKLTWDWFGQD
jgi:UDP-glucose 4-epimerase